MLIQASKIALIVAYRWIGGSHNTEFAFDSRAHTGVDHLLGKQKVPGSFPTIVVHFWVHSSFWIQLADLAPRH